MAINREYTIRISPDDQVRLTELAELKGKKPRSFAREILVNHLDREVVLQQQESVQHLTAELEVEATSRL